MRYLCESNHTSSKRSVWYTDASVKLDSGCNKYSGKKDDILYTGFSIYQVHCSVMFLRPQMQQIMNVVCHFDMVGISYKHSSAAAPPPKSAIVNAVSWIWLSKWGKAFEIFKSSLIHNDVYEECLQH